MTIARRVIPASLTALVVSAVLLGCGDAGPRLTGAPAAAPLFEEGGGAETVTTSERIPVEHGFAACDGALIVLTGEFHIVSHVTIGPNDDFHAKVNVNASGLTAEHEGVTYHGTAATNAIFNSSGTQTLTDNYHVIAEGQADNFNYHVTFHMTISPEGDVKTIVDNFKADCQG